MKTLGYLGLGVMGYGMTGNLIDKSGCDIYGYDPVPALRERFAARGGKVLDDAKTLYKTCDIIFMCLPTNAIVKATITEIMETARPGTTIVDMGSTSPYVIQELHCGGGEGLLSAGLPGQRRRDRRQRRHPGHHVRRRERGL